MSYKVYNKFSILTVSIILLEYEFIDKISNPPPKFLTNFGFLILILKLKVELNNENKLIWTILLETEQLYSELLSAGNIYVTFVALG